MYDDDAARRNARKSALTRAAGDAAANQPTPWFGQPPGAAVGKSIALARRAS
jgi:hypothetical protein